LLRAPPFPGIDAAVSCTATSGDKVLADSSTIFSLIREARVGGCFWSAPARLMQSAHTVLRPRFIKDLDVHPVGRANALWIAPSGGRDWVQALNRLVADDGGAWREDVDPWSALDGAQLLVAHGDDEWIALARIAGVAVRVLSPGRFGAPEDDEATLDHLAANSLAATQWRDPFTGEAATLETTIELLTTWRKILQENRRIAAACGIAWWKRAEIRRFLWHPQRSLRIVSSSARALAIARKTGSAVAIWPSRVSSTLIKDAQTQGVPLWRVEDGFVRSVGLGVELVPPSSIIIDSIGIHFDPSRPSELEALLNEAELSPRLLERARALRETIITAGISKYAAGRAALAPRQSQALRTKGRLVLVPGQVEDDLSVRLGGSSISNLELLRRVRALEPNAEIWFRPHPDVDAGLRKGAVADNEALTHANRIVRGDSMAALLDTVDAVHVLTSLTGFEALLREREVICHGTPFYAGWGLTRDLGEVPQRRKRVLTLDELVAAALILYPRYLDPVTGLPCPPEVLVSRMAAARASNRLQWLSPLRRWQGRLMAALR
jgi:capsular polysaccharide export protein